MAELNENLRTATKPAEFLDTLRAERREILNVFRKTRLTTLKPGILHGQVIPYATYSPWLNDSGFQKIYELAQSNTMVDIYRCHEPYRLAAQMKTVEGDLVEVGVWCGGTAAILAGAAPQKSIHLFDTFSGVAKADEKYDPFTREANMQMPAFHRSRTFSENWHWNARFTWVFSRTIPWKGFPRKFPWPTSMWTHIHRPRNLSMRYGHAFPHREWLCLTTMAALAGGFNRSAQHTHQTFQQVF